MTRDPSHSGEAVNEIGLLEFPYPYCAMLAICSDLDETEDASVYFTTSRYLNTKESTAWGCGPGLEVGNTMFFYMEPTEFSYWNTTDAAREEIRNQIQSGHVDAIHSFGDTATNRSQAAETLEHLATHDCWIPVWIDHAVAPTNFGADIMDGSGDVADSSAYHADLTLDYGVRYVWRGRVSSVHGQDAHPRLSGIWRRDRALNSAETLAKEAIKRIFGMFGSEKYGMHVSNDLLRDVRLRDGGKTKEFLRSNPHPDGISAGDNAAGLAAALTDEFLDNLIARSAKSIVYTHLGKQIDSKRGFPEKTREALARLADRQERGEILVTTTSRLLDYREAVRGLEWTATESDGSIRIDLSWPDSPLPAHGISFEIPGGRDCRLYVGDSPVEAIRHDKAGSDRAVVMLPWPRLGFPVP